jgi:hypothetical protein
MKRKCLETYLMWMLNMNTKAEFLQNPSFSFDYLVFGLIVLLIDAHWLYQFTSTHLLNMMENIHDITQTSRTLFNFTTEKYCTHRIMLLIKTKQKVEQVPERKKVLSPELVKYIYIYIMLSSLACPKDL